MRVRPTLRILALALTAKWLASLCGPEHCWDIKKGRCEHCLRDCPTR